MPRSNTSADESDAAPLSTSAIDPQHARAVTRQSLSFPSWDSAKRDEWQAFAMRVRAFVKRIGRRAIWDVVAGDRSLDEYDEDEDFKEADETLHCDLVLYVKGHEASEILQSSEDRFTDAWPKLMREFGAETSVRRMEIVRQLVTLNMDDYQHEMRRYKSACMELSRRVKEAQLSIDDVIIYSVLYGLDESYDAYKIITQDKLDSGTALEVVDVIGNLTNSSEVLTQARHLQQSGPIDVDRATGRMSGCARTERKDVCTYCKKDGHNANNCWRKNPEMTPEWYKQGGNQAESDVGLGDMLETMRSNSTKKLSFDEVKSAIAKATRF